MRERWASHLSRMKKTNDSAGRFVGVHHHQAKIAPPPPSQQPRQFFLSAPGQIQFFTVFFAKSLEFSFSFFFDFFALFS